MAYDYDKTHKNILKSAKKQFTKVGFQAASIRTICKEAGVTNGAFYSHFDSKEDLFDKLVEPCVNGLYELYSESSYPFMENDGSCELAGYFESTAESMTGLIRYMYAHKDDFLLILNAGAGTKYENFTRDFVDEETDNTMIFLEKRKPYMKRPENFKRSVAEFISSFVIGTIFSSFLNGEPLEETAQRGTLAGEFCMAGIARVLGLKDH
ncbi:MAG: TetR/AcrR family transcriptional regulator [Lachnospiraceae bacterium]|nr:TetR/AcrR family transcriptional regulator [Lachnospiraceae bacterium]